MNPVFAAVLNGAGWTGVSDFNDPLYFHGVRVQPGALHVGQEHIRGAGYAETGVDAALGFKQEVELFAGGDFNAVDSSGRRPGSRRGQPGCRSVGTNRGTRAVGCERATG